MYLLRDAASFGFTNSPFSSQHLHYRFLNQYLIPLLWVIYSLHLRYGYLLSGGSCFSLKGLNCGNVVAICRFQTPGHIQLGSVDFFFLLFKFYFLFCCKMTLFFTMAFLKVEQISHPIMNFHIAVNLDSRTC